MRVNAPSAMAPARFKVRISSTAQADLEVIALQSAEDWGKTEAKRYIDTLVRGFDRIQTFPYAGRSVDYSPLQLRALPIVSHVVYYHVHEADHVVDIVRVLHVRMDAARHLKDI